MKPKSKRKIELKDGYNKSVLIGILVVIVAVTTLATSKMWLPDSRAKKTINNEASMFFAMRQLDVKSYAVDIEENLGEMKFVEIVKNDKKKYDLSYKVYDDKNNELPTMLIDDKEVSYQENGYEKQVILQFGVPTEYYYIRVVIEQKDQQYQEIIVDYRDMKNKKLIEKGKDFLVTLYEEKAILLWYEEQVKILNVSIDESKLELESIQSMSAEEQKKKEKRVDELNTLITTSNDALSELEQQYEKQKEVVKSLEK